MVYGFKVKVIVCKDAEVEDRLWREISEVLLREVKEKNILGYSMKRMI